MLKSLLISLLQKLFPPPYELMVQIVAVLAKYREMSTLLMIDVIGLEYGKRPSLGNMYVALHHLERWGKIESRWGETYEAPRGYYRRRYYRLAKTVPWEEIKRQCGLN